MPTRDADGETREKGEGKRRSPAKESKKNRRPARARKAGSEEEVDVYEIDDRHRDKKCEMSRKHGNTLKSGTWRKTTGRFRRGRAETAKLDDVCFRTARDVPRLGLLEECTSGDLKQGPAGRTGLIDVAYSHRFRTKCVTERVPTDISSEDLEALRKAVRSLSRPGLAARLDHIIGKPVQRCNRLALPSFASKAITSATAKGL